ncbi:MAG: tetratricopeptide repeat protein [Deltaproteobacteria bacterium]|nr:tetratricopeptide repeat protein [Deltaproteobacteria bacterium]
MSCLKTINYIFVAFSIFFLSACHFYFGKFSWSFSYPGAHRELAEKLRQEGKADEAIAHYRKHIDERLADKHRKDSENPYFYYILIGDIYLETNRPTEALAFYKQAEESQVQREFVIDRLRQVASYFENESSKEKAIELLRANRDLDPLLFDADIDRIHKEIVKSELEGEENK